MNKKRRFSVWTHSKHWCKWQSAVPSLFHIQYYCFVSFEKTKNKTYQRCVSCDQYILFWLRGSGGGWGSVWSLNQSGTFFFYFSLERVKAMQCRSKEPTKNKQTKVYTCHTVWSMPIPSATPFFVLQWNWFKKDMLRTVI